MTRKTRTIGEVSVSPSAIEAIWKRQATDEAIAAARSLSG
jgi:hypothetical protein